MKPKTISQLKEELKKYNPDTYISAISTDKEIGCICGYCYEDVLYEPEPEIYKQVWSVNKRNKPNILECVDVLLIVPGYSTHRYY